MWKNVSKPAYKAYKSENTDVKKLLKQWNQLKLINDVLYLFKKEGDDFKKLIVVPKSLRNMILYHMHDLTGHQGVEHVTALVQQGTYWPTIQKDVAEFCRKCKRCQISKEPTPNVKTHMAHLYASRNFSHRLYNFGKDEFWFRKCPSND